MDLATLAPDLVETQSGLWVASDVDDVSYPEGGHARCHQLEESSFWFRHRTRCIVATLRRLPPAGPVFDIGGGTGLLASHLVEAGFVSVVVEPGASGAATAHGRGLRPVVNASLDTAGFLPGTLPGVGMFDVLDTSRTTRDSWCVSALSSKPGAGSTSPCPLINGCGRPTTSAPGTSAATPRRRYPGCCSGPASASSTPRTSSVRFPCRCWRCVRCPAGSDSEPWTRPKRPSPTIAPSVACSRILEAALDREVPVVERGGRMRFGTSILAVAVNPGLTRSWLRRRRRLGDGGLGGDPVSYRRHAFNSPVRVRSCRAGVPTPRGG